MSESVDDILRELSGISFAPSEEQTSQSDFFEESDTAGTEVSHTAHTPSVTETLLAVRELIEEPEMESGRQSTPTGQDIPSRPEPAKSSVKKDENKSPPDSRHRTAKQADQPEHQKKSQAIRSKQDNTHKQPTAQPTEKPKKGFFFRKKAEKTRKSAASSEKSRPERKTGDVLSSNRTSSADTTSQQPEAVSADSIAATGKMESSGTAASAAPAQPVSGATGQFTPLVRVTTQELVAELGQPEEEPPVPSRREKLVLAEGRTRRFVSAFQPEREETLQGGAALRRVTRRASSNVQAEEEQGMTLRIPVQSPDETPADETVQSPQTEPIPSNEETTSVDVDMEEASSSEQSDFEIDLEQIRAMDPLADSDVQADAEQDEQATRPIALDEPLPETKSAKHKKEEREKLRRQQQQQLLSRVEATENEPAPELSRSEIRKLKKQQQQEDRQRQIRRMQQREEQQKAASASEQEEKENIYRVREVSSSETAAGFAPAFRKLQRLNSAAEISSWRRALRDLAGTSIGMGLLIGFFAVVVLVLVSLNGLAGELVGNAVLMWSSVALGLIAGVCGFSVISGGIRSLLRFRASRDIMPMLLYLVTMAETVLLAFHPEELAAGKAFCYLPVGLFMLSAAYMSRWIVASTALRNLRFLHTGGSKYYLHVIRDSRLATEMTRGVVDGPAFVAVNRRTESVSDFMKLSLSVDESDRLSRNFSVIGLLSGLLVLGFAMLFGWSFSGAASLMTGVVCLFSPILTMYLFSYPCRRTAKFMERAGGVVISEKAIARYSLLNGALMDASDIFPPGFVTLSGLKTFGSARVDDVIIDAASMILGSGSVLESIFEGIIGDSGLLRPVEDRQYEDGKGLVGFVDGRQVLVGNKALLESRGIRFSLDEHRKWAAGIGCACVYLAVAGELAGVFLIRLQTSVRSEEAIQIFADNGVRLAIRTTDSFLTPRLLGRLFRINPELVKILPQRLGVYVDRLQGKVRVKQAVAVNDGSLSGFAGCAACARRLSFMEGLNRVMMVLSVVLGLCMLLMLTVLGSFGSVTPLVMSGYALFWPLLGWILQKMIRI